MASSSRATSRPQVVSVCACLMLSKYRAEPKKAGRWIRLLGSGRTFVWWRAVHTSEWVYYGLFNRFSRRVRSPWEILLPMRRANWFQWRSLWISWSKRWKSTAGRRPCGRCATVRPGKLTQVSGEVPSWWLSAQLPEHGGLEPSPGRRLSWESRPLNGPFSWGPGKVDVKFALFFNCSETVMEALDVTTFSDRHWICKLARRESWSVARPVVGGKHFLNPQNLCFECFYTPVGWPDSRSSSDQNVLSTLPGRMTIQRPSESVWRLSRRWGETWWDCFSSPGYVWLEPFGAQSFFPGTWKRNSWVWCFWCFNKGVNRPWLSAPERTWKSWVPLWPEVTHPIGRFST